MPDALSAGNLAFNPLYKEVKLRVTRDLAAGEWKAGEAIPSESRLAERTRREAAGARSVMPRASGIGCRPPP